MKILFLISFFTACAMKPINSPPNLVKEMWVRKLNKHEAISLYGNDFTEFNGGIYYIHQNTTWPKYIFYFDDQGQNINQNSLLSGEDLKVLKKNLKCKWIFKEKTQRSAHVIHHIETGSCEEMNLSYEEDPQYGMYRVELISVKSMIKK